MCLSCFPFQPPHPMLSQKALAMAFRCRVVVNLGLWDVAKCRYFEEERMYSLERDIAVGFEFDNTVEVALMAAARRDVKPTINYTHLNKLRPSKFQDEDTSPSAGKKAHGLVYIGPGAY